MKAMRLLSAILGVVSLSALSQAARAIDYLYVGDYAGKEVLRFEITPNAGPPGGDFIETDPRNTQAITSIGNTLLVSQPNNALASNHIAKYDLFTGAFQSEFAVSDSVYKMAPAANGASFYATQGGAITQFDFGTGSVLNSTALSGAWGITRNPLDGNLYVVTGWMTGGGQVYKYDPGLTTQTSVVTLPNDPLRGGAGIAFKSDGSFYVVAGGNADLTYNTNGLIYHYSAAGNLLDTISAPAGILKGAFDAEIAPDGNLYVSSYAGACVARFNTTTDTFLDDYITSHYVGLVSAKTLHIASYNAAVPEPGTLALLAVSGISALCFRRKRKK